MVFHVVAAGLASAPEFVEIAGKLPAAQRRMSEDSVEELRAPMTSPWGESGGALRMA